ncbi:hypothetical protein SAMD00019534_097680, partial [Acytostelium subglobosum LB1]|uniref:hypothetical protein n=1 Tax=Acytostelium subglobosum LB1 TaxID=1410327 RepID=UPI000644CC28
MNMNLIKIPPYSYIHVLDTNKNVSRLEVGPQTFLCKEHEKIAYGPKPMHVIPKLHYCIVENPVIKDPKTGVQEMDKHGQARLRHGQREIRFEQNDPFPLYPGEVMVDSKIMSLSIVLDNEALKLKALCDFTAANGKKRKAGEEYLFVGPSTYHPTVEEQVVEKVKAIIVRPHQAIKLRARIDFIDRQDKQRKSGEEWLITEEGAFLQDPYEELVEHIEATVLDEKISIILEARKNFNDNGIERKKGQQWLLTKEDTSLYIPQPEVKIDRVVPLTVLNSSEYAVIQDYQDEETHVNMMGKKKMVRGPALFFLKPGESIVSLENVRVLGPEDAIQVTALEEFDDTVTVAGQIKSIRRKAGTRWYIYGPAEWVPPIQVKELSKIKAIVNLEDLNIHIFSPIYLFSFIAIILYLLIKLI